METSMDFMAKVAQFAVVLETDQVNRLHEQGLACQGNLDNVKVRVTAGKKYVKVDLTRNGRYMIDIATETIYGIKAYGVIHKGHCFGTLDTIDQWYWGEYRGIRKSS